MIDGAILNQKVQNSLATLPKTENYDELSILTFASKMILLGNICNVGKQT